MAPAPAISMNSVWVVGCGYVGERVARAELKDGRTVSVWVRTLSSADKFAGSGFTVVQQDLDQTTIAAPVAKDQVIYYFVPPPANGVTDPRITRFLASLGEAPRVQRVVLISTSGVYGNCHGNWVTETRAAHPEADRAQRRWDAEQSLRRWSEKNLVPIVILRVPGIYGPGRLPLERLRAGEPVLSEAESPWSNRVHVDDLVSACLAAARRGRPGAVYNISDGTPTTMTDYFNRVADATGLPRPPQITLAEAGTRLNAGMRSYLAESKRLDTRAMREELGVVPNFPDLASGLAACVRVSAEA